MISSDGTDEASEWQGFIWVFTVDMQFTFAVKVWGVHFGWGDHAWYMQYSIIYFSKAAFNY